MCWSGGTNPAATGVKSNRQGFAAALQADFGWITWCHITTANVTVSLGVNSCDFQVENDGPGDLRVINGLVLEKHLLLPAEDSDLNPIVMTPENIRAAGLARLF